LNDLLVRLLDLENGTRFIDARSDEKVDEGKTEPGRDRRRDNPPAMKQKMVKVAEVQKLADCIQAGKAVVVGSWSRKRMLVFVGQLHVS
jgi:hypothetical protein